MLKIILVVSTLLCPIMMNCVENNNMEQWEKDCRNIREHQLEYSKFYVDKTILTCENKQEYDDYKERKQIEIDKRIQEKVHSCIGLLCKHFPFCFWNRLYYKYAIRF